MHRKLHMIVIAGMLVALAVVSVASGTSAGPLDPTAGPTNTNAYTLDQLWNRLSAGAAGTPSAFTEPSSGPDTGTMHTLDEIMALAPVVDDTNGASAAEVAGGKTFWGLTTGGWGVNSGTAAVGSNISGANGSLTFAIPNGFYTGKTATAQDPALAAGNIREGANIFGVAGTSIQASGTVVAGEVLLDKTFSNASGAGTGSMPNRGARDVYAWDSGPNDSGGVSQWFRHGRRGHGPNGGEHPGWGDHLRGGRHFDPGERDRRRG